MPSVLFYISIFPLKFLTTYIDNLEFFNDSYLKLPKKETIKK